MYIDYEPDAEYYVQTLSGARSSGYTPVELRTGYAQDNVLLNKEVTASKGTYSGYPLSNMVDGDLGNRAAMTDNTEDTTVTIHLGAKFSLDELRLYEYKNTSGNNKLDTRAGETTIWVYNKGEEIGEPVFTGSLQNPHEVAYTSIDMGYAIGDTIQFLFKNTDPAQAGRTVSLHEVTCSGSPIDFIDKSGLALLLYQAEELSAKTQAHTEAVVNLLLAQKSASAVFGNIAATENAVTKACETLTAAIDVYMENEQWANILLGKALSAEPEGRSGYETKYLNDGDIETRCAPPDDIGGKHVVTFNLGEAHIVDSVYVVEFVQDGGRTRGGDSTLEVYQDGTWVTAWKGSLTDHIDKTITPKGITEIWLEEPLAASQLRFTFINTVNPKYTATIWEISAAGEKHIADTEALELLVNQAAALQQADYTTSTWAGFETALDEAVSLLSKTAPAQSDIDSAHAALESAKDALVYIGALRAEYLLHQDKVQGSYTDDSWAGFEAARTKAADTLAKPDASTQEVAEALTGLQNSVEALVETPDTPPDKTALRTLYEQHEGRQNDGYTAESWNRFETALLAAWQVLEDTEANQAQIDDAYGTLVAAEAGLRADKSDLATVIAEAEALNREDFEAEGWPEMLAALLAAQGVNGNESAAPAEVAAAASALRDAIDALTPAEPIGPPDPQPADTSELQKLYDEHSKLVNDNCTEGSWYTFLGALDEAALVLKNENATQTQVDGALQNLQEAINALAKKTQLPILEGSTLVFTGGQDVVIRVDADIEDFRSASLDARLLTRGAEYTVEAGSTVITLPASLLEGRENGEYEFYADFADGFARASLTVNIPAPSPSGGSGGTGGASGSGSNNAVNTGGNVAKTGDASDMLLYVALCAAAALASCVLVLRSRTKRREDNHLSEYER